MCANIVMDGYGADFVRVFELEEKLLTLGEVSRVRLRQALLALDRIIDDLICEVDRDCAEQLFHLWYYNKPQTGIQIVVSLSP